MAMTVIKRCPKCKTAYEAGTDTRGIGIPYKICSNCGTYVIDKDNNEWELKNPLEKLWYIFILIWTSFLFGLAGPLIFLFLREAQKIQISDSSLLYIWGACSIALLFWMLYKHSNEVQESANRMQNIKYRNILKKLGILKE
jgi:hypothetical protein